MVGAEGFEPPALCSQSRCATRLRYAPTFLSDCIADRIHLVGVATGLMRRGPDEEPDHKHQRNGEDKCQRSGQQQQKDPVLTGVAAGLTQVAAQEQVIAAIWLEGDVEDVAEDARDRI